MIKEKKIRQFSGRVVSHKMAKTIVVLVENSVRHKIYGKQFKVSKGYKVHDAKNEYKVGDRVIFQECRPISKDKRWRVIKKIS